MASRISVTVMYSSAVWEREDSPGPIFKDGKCISAWSESVGEPKGVRPKALALATMGWVLVYARRIQAERAGFHFTVRMGAGRPVDFFVGVVFIAAYVYGETHWSGTTLCCVPAWMTVTLIFTSPKSGEVFGNRYVLNHSMSFMAL